MKSLWSAAGFRRIVPVLILLAFLPSLAVAGLAERFEAGFARFAAHVETLLDGPVGAAVPPDTRNALREPLALFTENRTRNPERLRPVPGERRFSDNRTFAYALLPEQHRGKAAAGFRMQDRILFLSPDYNPDSLFDNLVVYHELVHALQDATLRRHLAGLGERGRQGLANYLGMLDEGMLDPDLEPVAYAHELELADLLLAGELRRAIAVGRVPVAAFARRLGARGGEENGAYQALLRYAVRYFTDDCAIYSYSRAYRAVVLADHARLGLRFFASEDRFIKDGAAGRGTRPGASSPVTNAAPVFRFE